MDQTGNTDDGTYRWIRSPEGDFCVSCKVRAQLLFRLQDIGVFSGDINALLADEVSPIIRDFWFGKCLMFIERPRDISSPHCYFRYLT